MAVDRRWSTWWSCVQTVVSVEVINLRRHSSSFPPSTFPSGNELPRSLCQSVSTVFFILFFLKESVMYAQQLVCRGSGQGWWLTLRISCLGECLPWWRRGLGTEGVLTGGRVRAHAIYVSSGWQGHCRKGSGGWFWRAQLSFWKSKKEIQDRVEEERSKSVCHLLKKHTLSKVRSYCKGNCEDVQANKLELAFSCNWKLTLCSTVLDPLKRA